MSNGLIKLETSELRAILSAVNNQPSLPDQDEMAIPSYLHRNPLIRWLMWRRLECVIKMAELRSNSTVLDFGCGLGLLFPTLCEVSANIYGIDLFPVFAKELTARRGLNVRFLTTLADVPSASLDIIFATDVMEHLDEPVSMAKDFAGKLVNKGSLIISGPTEKFVYKAGRVLAGFSGKGHYHHHNIFDLERDILSTNLFKISASSSLPLSFGPSLFKILKFDLI